MIDITKCLGTNCPKKDSCWRYKSPAYDILQSYTNSHGCIENEFELYWPYQNSSNEVPNIIEC